MTPAACSGQRGAWLQDTFGYRSRTEKIKRDGQICTVLPLTVYFIGILMYLLYPGTLTFFSITVVLVILVAVTLAFTAAGFQRQRA